MARKPKKPEPTEHHKMGYARVSTSDQDMRLQRDALIAAGVDPRDIFEEKVSGASLAKRREFAAMMKDCREGDIVYVWKLDRLARNAVDLYQTAKAIEERGATLVVLTMPGMDTSTPVGKAMFGMLAVFAEFERAIAHERTMAGLEAARKAGRVGGRKPLYTLAELEKAAELGTKPGARSLKMTPSGFLKALERERARVFGSPEAAAIHHPRQAPGDIAVTINQGDSQRTRRREPPEPVTILRQEYDALVYVFELAEQWVQANEIDDRPNRNEAEAFLPGAVKRAKEAMRL